jgi:ABC-2 type transport system permease protein
MTDALIFTGRSVRHSLRSIDAIVTAIALPVLLMLMFVYVFGGAIAPDGDYVDYVVPGLILLCAGFGSASTAVAVNDDMTGGVIDRFRSLPIAAPAVLAGHVAASTLRNLASTLVVLAVGLLVGFRPHGGPLAWLGVLGLLLAFMCAISWLAACFGLLARSAEAAGAFSFFVMFLPYVSSAFVPPETMPGGLQWIAAHQPVTPIVESLRALMMGTPVGGDAVTALLWCAAIAAAGIGGSAVLFRSRVTH